MTRSAVLPFGSGLKTNGAAISTAAFVKPTAKYPAQLADDSWLTVAINNLQTELAIPCGVSDTTIGVTDASGVRQWTLLTIGSEIVLVMLPPSGNVITVQRGYDGTSAVAHAAKSVVSGFVDAWHHNALASEVEAIEATLGPNLANVSAYPVNVSTRFNFTPQTPGGTLNVGANTITLNPMPAGITAASVGTSKLYISGGTGAAEAVPVIGWSASGVTVTCANPHSGGWSISSATAGIQEAIIAAGNGSVYIPAGTHNTFATITVPTSISPEIYGVGGISTMIAPQFAAGDVITYASPSSIGSCNIHDLAFTAGARSSGAFIGQRGNMVSGIIRDIWTSGGYDGVVIENGNGCFTRNLHINGNSHYGVYIHATGVMGGRHEGWTISGATGCIANLAILAESGGAVAGIQFTDLALQRAQFNIILNALGGPINETLFTNLILDSSTNFGVRINGAAGGNGIHFDTVRGGTDGGGLFDVYPGFSDVTIVNGSMSVSGPANGIVFRGVKNSLLAGLNVTGGGTGNPNDIPLILTTDSGVACDSIRIVDSSFGFSGTGATTGNVATFGLSIPTTGHRNVVIANTSFFGSTAPISDNNDVSPQYIGWIRGLSDTAPSVASSATVTFPRMTQGGTVTISGTTGVTAVAGLYTGQTGFIRTTGAVTFTAGATIGTTVTTVANTLTPLWFDGTKLWLR